MQYNTHEFVEVKKILLRLKKYAQISTCAFYLVINSHGNRNFRLYSYKMPNIFNRMFKPYYYLISIFPDAPRNKLIRISDP